MASEYGALCTDFLINHKLSLRMDLPCERDTLLSLLERMRKQRSRMQHLRRFEGEVVLETDPDQTPYEWLSLRRTSIRSSVEHPDSNAAAYAFHREILEIAPFFLSVSPLDVEYVELAFGFDFEVETNRNDVVFEALFAESPLASLVNFEQESLMECQPLLVVALDERCEQQAIIDIKTRVTANELRSGRFQTAAISLLCRLRDERPVASIDSLPSRLDGMARRLEQFVDDRVIPRILSPIREVISSRPS